MVRKPSIQGFQLFDSLIDIVLSLEFCLDISILQMVIFDKIVDIEIEPALVCVQSQHTSISSSLLS